MSLVVGRVRGFTPRTPDVRVRGVAPKTPQAFWKKLDPKLNELRGQAPLKPPFGGERRLWGVAPNPTSFLEKA